MAETKEKNKNIEMITGDPKRAIRKLSLPMMLSMLLITMYNPHLLLSKQVIGDLKKHYEDKLFNTTISRNVKLTEAPGYGMPVYYYDKNAKGSKEYLEVARELAERI